MTNGVQNPGAFSRHISRIKKLEKLSLDEELDLISKAQNGDKRAENKVIAHNLIHAWKLACQWSRSTSWSKEDLYSQCCLGLVLTIRKFDVNLGVRFLTYAQFRMKTEMKKLISTLDHSFSGSTAPFSHTTYYPVKRALSGLPLDATLDDKVRAIAAECEIGEKFAGQYLDRYYNQRHIQSLDAPGLNGHSGKFEVGDGELLSDFVCEQLFSDIPLGAEEELIMRDAEQKLASAIDSLPPNEREVLIGRHLSQPKVSIRNLRDKLRIAEATVIKLEERAIKTLIQQF